MGHFNGAKQKKWLRQVLILAALLYSLFLSITGIYSAVTQQIQITLQQQISSAKQAALEGEEMFEPVYLRRDQNHQITAITVNGILLNQLQAEYSHQLLQCATTYPVRLSVADILGSKWLSWFPGGISFTLRPAVTWKAEVISRTFSNTDSTRCFQVVLVTNSAATVFPWQQITLQDELILFEAILYHATR